VQVLPGEMFEEDVMELLALAQLARRAEGAVMKRAAPRRRWRSRRVLPAHSCRCRHGRSRRATARRCTPGPRPTWRWARSSSRTQLHRLPCAQGGRRRLGHLPPAGPHQHPGALLAMVEMCSTELNLGLFPKT
jgi:hypothetical protein